MSFRNLVTVFLSINFIITGCAPSFAEFQGADVVGKGIIVVTPYISSTFSDDVEEIGGDGELQDSKGLRLAYGLKDKLDAHLKLESIDGGLINGTVMSLGLKYLFYGNEKHRFSGYLPISHSTQKMNMSDLEDIEESSSQSNKYQTIEPTFLGSSNLFSNFDINYSAKMLIYISGDAEEDPDNGYAFNISSSIPVPKLEHLTVIPEYGILEIDDQSFSHMGVGFSYKIK